MANDSKTSEVWTAVYWQHHVRDEDEFDSLEEAVSFLEYGLETNALNPEAIRSPEGAVYTRRGVEWTVRS